MAPRAAPLKVVPKAAPPKAAPKTTPVMAGPKTAPLTVTPKSTPLKAGPKVAPIKAGPRAAPRNAAPRAAPRNAALRTPLSPLGNSRISKPKSSLRRLKNGILDVKYMGKRFTVLSMHNKHTKLIRLPTEIRNKIWRELLGHRTIKLKQRIGHQESKVGGIHSLLRVCRQTYIDAARLPYKLNIFKMNRFADFGQVVNAGPEYQSESVTKVAISVVLVESAGHSKGLKSVGTKVYTTALEFLKRYPKVNHLHLNIYKDEFQHEDFYDEHYGGWKEYCAQEIDPRVLEIATAVEKLRPECQVWSQCHKSARPWTHCERL